MSRVKMSGDTPVPMAWLFACIGASALAGGAWFVLRAEVVSHAEQIKALKAEQSTDHDMLVRIDERTAQMHEAMKKLAPVFLSDSRPPDAGEKTPN